MVSVGWSGLSHPSRINHPREIKFVYSAASLEPSTRSISILGQPQHCWSMRPSSIPFRFCRVLQDRARGALRLVGQLILPVILFIAFLGPAPAQAASYSCNSPLGWWESPDLKPLFTTQAPQSDCDFQQWSWSAFVHYMKKTGPNGRPLFLSLPTPTALEDKDQRLTAALESITPDELFLRPRFQEPGLARLATPGKDDLGAITQAGSNGILIDPNSRVIYYSTHMNPVFYAFAKNHVGNEKYNKTPAGTNFPIDSTVIKAAWMVADDPAALPKDAYTTTATLQLLENDPDHPGQIRPSAKTKSGVNVALVGVHVVGVVKDHPEFLWATFEPTNNAPDLPPGTVPGSSQAVSNRSFSLYKANTPAKQSNQLPTAYSVDEETQKATPITTVFRQFAYGGAEFSAESPKVSGQARVDDINSINANFQAAIPEHGSQISPEFANYNLIGTLWLDTTQTPLEPGLDLAANSVGSITLANSSMETFVQGIGTNCFSCHNTSPFKKGFSDKNIAISHIIAGSLTSPAA